MGCITSKAIARSMSIREEYFSNGFQSRAVAWEELTTSQNRNDNTKTSRFALPSRDPETALEPEPSAHKWDFITDMAEKAEVQDLNSGRFTRSKSCQIRGETENALNSKDKNVAGSRSFHTVEEYDALLERIHKRDAKSSESFEDYLSSLDVKNSQQSKSPDEDQNVVKIQRDLLEEAGNKKDDKLDHSEKGVRETGWKRKSIAKGLRSLDVCTVEFPAIARVRQWIPVEGQVFSPGTYMTPKFGSYNSKVNLRERKEESGEVSVFSPELIAAFEDYMQQLQVEEDGILSHLDGHLPVESS